MSLTSYPTILFSSLDFSHICMLVWLFHLYESLFHCPPHISTRPNASLPSCIYWNVTILTKPSSPSAFHIVSLLYTYFLFFLHSTYYLCHLCNLLLIFIVLYLPPLECNHHDSKDHFLTDQYITAPKNNYWYMVVIQVRFVAQIKKIIGKKNGWFEG